MDSGSRKRAGMRDWGVFLLGTGMAVTIGKDVLDHAVLKLLSQVEVDPHMHFSLQTKVAVGQRDRHHVLVDLLMQLALVHCGVCVAFLDREISVDGNTHQRNIPGASAACRVQPRQDMLCGLACSAPERMAHLPQAPLDVCMI